MANFTTHIAAGTIVSGGLATVTLAANVVAPENLVAVTLCGVLGSVLPDIDLKDSRPSRAMFSGLAVFFSFVALFLAAPLLSIAEMWIVWLGTLVFIRYGAEAIFHRMSYHRGIYHSILAAVFFAFLTAAFFKLIGRHEGVAWLAAGFMFIGYLVHLTLDEIYSVDVMDTRIKASFGTALKLLDAKHPWHSASMGVATVLVFLATPPTKTFVEELRSPQLWTGLQQRLLPKDNLWFGGFGPFARLALGQRSPANNAPASDVPETSPITTGSIPDRTPLPADNASDRIMR